MRNVCTLRVCSSRFRTHLASETSGHKITKTTLLRGCVNIVEYYSMLRNNVPFLGPTDNQQTHNSHLPRNQSHNFPYVHVIVISMSSDITSGWLTFLQLPCPTQNIKELNLTLS